MNQPTRSSPSRSGYPSTSPTGRAMEHMALYGAHRSEDDPEYRPMPTEDELEEFAQNLMGALSTPLADTALEDDVPNLLWSIVNVFHRAAERVERELDDTELKQRESQQQQDGSEVRSVELERLIAKHERQLARRDAYETLRDQTAKSYEGFTGSGWRPSSGSKVNHRTLTAAMIDSRDQRNARRQAKTQVLVPKGPLVLVSGGVDYNDVNKIWSDLDKVLEKHPDMTLGHTAKNKGTDAIAVAWAHARHVTDVPYKLRPTGPNDTNAGWRRHEEMLDDLPIGVIVYPGTGTIAHLRRRAWERGIPVINHMADGVQAMA